ncbi:MAG: hypothetical protein F4X64_00745, partial [Chloroflexi bacterium]|nr:hypothetical protein [Chloroflexota bacterium]
QTGKNSQHERHSLLSSINGRRGIGRALLGSVADRIVRHSQAPTLLVRAPAPLRAEAEERREKELALV